MYALYQALARLARLEFVNIVTEAAFMGGSPASPNKLRLRLIDGSFLDIWISADGDYAYHWEHRAQRGYIHRWDNAPHHPRLGTFPEHLHQESEGNVVESYLPADPRQACRQVLCYIQARLAEYHVTGGD